MSPVILVLLALVVLVVLVLWHSRNTVYECPECKKKFKISFFTDLLSPHWPALAGGRKCLRGYKHLRCPYCKARVKAKEVK